MIEAKTTKIIAKLMRPRLPERAEKLTLEEQIKAAAYKGYFHVAVDYVDKKQRLKLKKLGYKIEDRDYYFVISWE